MVKLCNLTNSLLKGSSKSHVIIYWFTFTGELRKVREDLKVGRGGLVPDRESVTIDLDSNCWIE
jgi:hypothetical protein